MTTNARSVMGEGRREKIRNRVRMERKGRKINKSQKHKNQKSQKVQKKFHLSILTFQLYHKPL
jgi:hypothetical protein